MATTRGLCQALVVATTLTACTTRLPDIPEDPRHELTSVPFFPQTIHQCGPAALATMLGATGADLTPAQLSPLVYIPGRRGSLQVEMLAAARTQGRVAYVLEPRFAALEAELTAGNPVLVLQDLGGLGLRLWHFAVVVGYDPASEVLILRSGRERRQLERRARFEQTWETGGRWAAVITRADQLPATATGGDYIRALSAAAPHLAPGVAARAEQAALARWPDDPLVLLANGNQAFAAGHVVQAIVYYRSLLARDPRNVAARNNLANALLDTGCPQAALAAAEQAAAEVAPESPLAAAVQDTLAKARTASAAGLLSACGAE